jgi:hypothetical protein
MLLIWRSSSPKYFGAQIRATRVAIVIVNRTQALGNRSALGGNLIAIFRGTQHENENTLGVH